MNAKKLSNIDAFVESRIAKALETNNLELKSKIAEQETEIKKLSEHNECFKETIEYLESQLRSTTADLTKASMTLQQSFNHRHKLSDLIRQDEGGTFKHQPSSGKGGAIGLEEEDSSFERDSTHLN